MMNMDFSSTSLGDVFRVDARDVFVHYAAVVAFQVAKGLVPDGEVGLATRKALKLG